MKEFISKGLNHIPILPINPDPIVKELKEVWIKVASIMHINVLDSHFEAIHDIVNKIFFEVFPHFIKNQPPWFFDKNLMDELNFISNHLFISGLDKAAQTPGFHV